MPVTRQSQNQNFLNNLYTKYRIIPRGAQTFDSHK